MRLMVESDFRIAGGLIGAGVEEMRWPRPVRPGDVLRVESEVLDVRPSRSNPDRGIVRVRNTTLNQDGQPVMVQVANLMVPRKPADGDERRPIARTPSRGIPACRVKFLARRRMTPVKERTLPIQIHDHDGSAKVLSSTLSRTLNSLISALTKSSPSRLVSTFVAFLIPPKSL